MTARAPSEAPTISGVLETVLYFSDQDRAQAFYSDLLGLRLVAREPKRSLFYRLGTGMLLLFDPGYASKGRKLPPHGASGPIHVCFRVPPKEYAGWKRRLEAQGVPILREVRWERGMSFYFTDPDGNLLELANADIWPD